MNPEDDVDRGGVDALAAAIPALIDRMLIRHHATVRARLTQIDRLIRQVVVFPVRPQALCFVARYERFKLDLLAHFEKEEREDFPAFLAIARGWSEPSARSGIPALIHTSGHELGGRDLRDLFALVVRLPDGNKPRLMASLRGQFAAMADEYLRHSRDEDDLLMPAVIAVHDALVARLSGVSAIPINA